MPDVVAVGECLIDLIATQAETPLFDVPAFEPQPGGAPANVAVGVARLGRSAAFVGRVGRDEFGQGLRRLLTAEGVQTRWLLDDPDLMTTLAFVGLSQGGEPHFAFAPGAHTRLTPADFDPELFRSARFVHGGSVALAHEPSRAATLAAFRLARECGALCSYDLNWRPFLWPDRDAGRAIVAAPLDRIDLLKLSALDLQVVMGPGDDAEQLAALATTARLVVVTLGGDGCLARHDGRVWRIPPVPGVVPVDATGAGDAFMAALLATLPPDRAAWDVPTVERALARATRAGAVAVTRRGAIPALPRLADLDAPLSTTPA